MSEFPQPDAQPPAAESPSIVDDLDKALDPDSVTVARIVTAIWMMILAIPLAAAAIPLAFSDLGTSIWIWIGAGGVGYAALFAWSLYWPGVRYRHASYRVAESGLWIRRGVVWRSEISVPKSRVQHTDVSQGPLQRRFDLATLVLHTAGTQHAAVSLGGLSHTAALAIRDYLIEGGADDAV